MAWPRGGCCNKGEKEKNVLKVLRETLIGHTRVVLFPEGVWENINKHFLSAQYLPGVWMIL